MIALCMSLEACDVEFSDNGALDGFWQMTSVDTIATGGVRNMVGSKIYWSVQKELLEVKQIGFFGILFRFEYNNAFLTLSNPYVNDRDSSDIKVEDVSLIQPMGVNSLDEQFQVLQLDNKIMKLQSPILRLNFRRY